MSGHAERLGSAGDARRRAHPPPSPPPPPPRVPPPDPRRRSFLLLPPPPRRRRSDPRRRSPATFAFPSPPPPSRAQAPAFASADPSPPPPAPPPRLVRGDSTDATRVCPRLVPAGSVWGPAPQAPAGSVRRTRRRGRGRRGRSPIPGCGWCRVGDGHGDVSTGTSPNIIHRRGGGCWGTTGPPPGAGPGCGSGGGGIPEGYIPGDLRFGAYPSGCGGSGTCSSSLPLSSSKAL